MAADDIFPFNMNSAEGGRSFCASVVEDVLQQRKSGFNDILALRRAEESVSRRHQAAAWLRKMAGLIGSRDLPNDPSEEEFLLGLRNGMILCNVINKVHHGSVPKVVENPIDSVHLPDGAALSAYQYFENVRNFLVAIEEMGLPSFEASDLEKGGSCMKVVNCILALKSYNEWKQAGANGSWKFGNSMKHPTPGKCILRVGKNSDPFMNAYRNMSQIDSNVMSEPKIGEYSNGFPVNISMDATKMRSSNHSLGTLVRAALSDRRPEEVPTLVESMLMKVMEEFECRLANQNKQITDTIKNLSISDDRKSLPSAKLSDSLSSTCGETMAEYGGVMKVKEEVPFSNLTMKEGCASWARKQFLFDQQQEDIKKLKNALQFTKTCIQLMQEKYYEEFSDLGRHFQDLAHAASGYHKVLEENRQLYNQVQDLKGSIRVYCRVRPFLPGLQKGISTVENFGDGNITISNPLKQEKGSRRSFTFNKVFGPFSSQEEVFSDTKPLIRSVLDGYNVCIFAYGQTGSGKTYTMTGPTQITVQTQGVNFRALSDLFDLSEQRKDSFIYSISVQMIEIYNEQVRDLLVSDNNKRLEIRNNSQQNGFNVPEASLVPVTSTSEVIELMNIGQRNRAVGSTALNDRSSRSHSCLTVHVQGRDTISGTILRGCLHLVDLAGSERVDKSEVTGDRLKEAQYINKSLSALGDVVAALAQKNSHIPYRNSKLTQLLQDSLGGQAKTLMFVHISPEADALGETISTLKFAERVSTVELGAARMNKESGEIRELREQIASLKAALARKNEKPDLLPSSRCSPEIQTPPKHDLLPPMQIGHNSHRPPMEDAGNFTFQGNSFGGKKKGKHGQQETSTDSTSPLWPDNRHNGLHKAGDDGKEPGSCDWVDKVIVDMRGAGEDTPTPLRCWDNNDDNSPVPDTFYRGYIADMRSVVYHDQFNPIKRKENHDNNILRRTNSMTTDDMDELEVGTSDSSEADLLWHFNLPSSCEATHSGAARMKKTKSRLASKSMDIRNMNGAAHSRKLASGGGQKLLQKTPTVTSERKRSAGKIGANGSVK